MSPQTPAQSRSIRPGHISTVPVSSRPGSHLIVYELHGMCVCPKPTPRSEAWGHECLRCHRPVKD